MEQTDPKVVTDVTKEPVAQPDPAKPETPSKLAAVLGIMQICTFKFSYKGAQGVKTDYVLKEDLESAITDCKAYCDKHRLKFVDVTPMFFDLNKKPAPKHFNRQVTDEEYNDIETRRWGG